MSGVSGNADTGGPAGAFWQQQIQQMEDQYHGVPTCTYQFFPAPPGNPNGYFWIGNCELTFHNCTALPPAPPNTTPETGTGPSCPSCGRPINLSNGNTYIQQSDISLPGLGGGLTLTRTWNSMWPTSQNLMSEGLFGNKWKSTYEEKVFQGGNDIIKYSRSVGDFWSFQLISLNGGPMVYQVIAPANVHATMTLNSGVWTLTFPTGEKRTFDLSTGVLTSISDRNGNTMQLTYDGSGRLVTVTDAASRHLYFNYASPNSYLVTSVSSDVSPTWSYAYDADNRLSQVTKPDQTTISFTYDAQSLITAVKDSQGKILESHTYDSNARGLTSSQANGVEAVTVGYPQ